MSERTRVMLQLLSCICLCCLFAVPPARAATGGSLRVIVSGLVRGQRADVFVRGLHFHRVVHGSATLTRLRSGGYTVAGAAVALPRGGRRYPVVVSQHVGVASGKRTVARVRYAVDLPKTTKLLSAMSNARLSGDSRTLVVGRRAPLLRRGDIVVAPPGKTYLVKVLRVRRRSRGGVAARVRKAVVTEALPAARLSLGDLRASSASASGKPDVFKPFIETALLECSAAKVDVGIEGSIDPKLNDLSISWGVFDKPHGRLAVTIQGRMVLTFAGEAGAICETRAPGVHVITIPLPPLKLEAGPVPVLITRAVDLYLYGRAHVGSRLSVELGLEFQGGLAMDFRVGEVPTLKAWGGPRLVHDFSPSAVTLGVEGFLVPDLSYKIYGVAGIEADLGAGARADVNPLSNTAPWWTLDGCLAAGAGLVAGDKHWDNPTVALGCVRLKEGGLSPPTPPTPPSTTPTPTPTPPPQSMDARQVSAKATGTCAVRDSGEVGCWGAAVGYQQTSMPRYVPGLTDASEVSLGSQFACAVHGPGGNVACWGVNDDGELGDGTTTTHQTPVAVRGLTDAVEVSAGDRSACAVVRSGSVWCWGYGDRGLLGQGNKTSSSTAVQVEGVTDAIQVDVAATRACAVIRTGRVECWGSQWLGTGHDPADGHVAGPATVTGIADGTALTTWDFFNDTGNSQGTCVVRRSGQVACWGSNQQGEMGDGTEGIGFDRPLPVAVAGLFDAVAVAGGAFHACALRRAGGVECWGVDPVFANYEDGHHTTPQATPGTADAAAFSTGDYHTCVIRGSGELACGGSSFDGQLGFLVPDPLLTYPISGVTWPDASG